MQRFTKIAIFAVSLGAIIGSQIMTANVTSAVTPDPIVKAALEKANRSYEVLENGNFQVVISFAGTSRKQIVYINSDTDQIPTSSVRKIYAFPKGAQLDEKTLDYALKTSSKKIFGNWEVNGSGNLVFVAKVDANLNSTELDAVIDRVAVDAYFLSVEMNLPNED